LGLPGSLVAIHGFLDRKYLKILVEIFEEWEMDVLKFLAIVFAESMMAAHTCCIWLPFLEMAERSSVFAIFESARTDGTFAHA